jgi:hypothetical protein
MSIVEREEVPTLAVGKRRSGRLRPLRRALLAIFTAQYTIITIVVGLSVAGILRYFVTPQILATFEALAVALKR